MSGRPEAERLLRIGPFARQANLSPHQLRHYHELRLLLPVLVDPESGYRYYAEAQAATAEAIAVLRSVDMPLAEIKDLLADRSRGQVQAALDRQRARLERRLAEAREKLERLQQLAEEGRLVSDAQPTGELVEVLVLGVRLHVATNQHVVLLREKDGERVLPVWIGQFEANGIAVRLQGFDTVRPLTHDFMWTAMSLFGVEIERVVITRHECEVFYAAVEARRDGQAEVIDARPSDALNVALRAGAPVFVGAAVLAEHAHVPSTPDEIPAPPTCVVTAWDAETNQQLGMLFLPALPEPGQTVDVPSNTAWAVVAVEPGKGQHPPRVRVRRPRPE
jgi:bifunctional DNase/RNase